MNVVRANYNRKGIVVSNEQIEKLSDSQLKDTVFLPQAEIEDAAFLAKVESILAKKELTLVIDKAKECKNNPGNFRTFIGDLKYRHFTTAIE